MSPEVETMPDTALLAAVGQGDERALAELHRRYAATVFAFVTTRVTDRGTAEEVSADVWLGCWRSARAFRGDSRVLTWLLGIAKRQAWSRGRRRVLPAVPLDTQVEGLVDDTVGPDDQVLETAGVEELLEALRSLPPDLVEVVSLAWLHELPYSEIAQAPGGPGGDRQEPGVAGTTAAQGRTEEGQCLTTVWTGAWGAPGTRPCGRPCSGGRTSSAARGRTLRRCAVG